MLLPDQYCFNHLMDRGQKDSCVLERNPALGKGDVRNPIDGLISKYVQNAVRRGGSRILYRCPQMSHEALPEIGRRSSANDESSRIQDNPSL